MNLAAAILGVSAIILSSALAGNETIGHLAGIRGGRTSNPNDPLVRPVVALIRRYKKFDETKGTWVFKESICSGTVVNRRCVLTAAHCTPGPDEINLSFEVFSGTSVEKRNAVAQVAKVIRRLDGLAGNDIAMLSMDALAPQDRSFYTSNLHRHSDGPLQARSTLKIVGYGAVNSNYDVETGEWTHVGSGEKREGEMKVSHQVTGERPLIKVEPGDENHAAVPGDSGGPLLLSERTGIKLYGVAGTMNAEKAVNASENAYISVAHHMPWLKASMEELGCTEKEAQVYNLRDVLLKKFGSFADAQEALENPKLGSPGNIALQPYVLKALGYSDRDYAGAIFSHAHIDTAGNLSASYILYTEEKPQTYAAQGEKRPPHGQITIPAPPR